MLFERIESEGLAHYSYLVGDRGEAMVIDPRRDCQVYMEKAARRGYRIRHIMETHRHEDFVSGSVELSEQSGAEIWHAEPELEYGYGSTVSDGQSWKIGRLRVKSMHTPGHTTGHMSYILHEAGGAPWIIFTGDALFAGDLGRTDLAGPNRIREMTDLLYNSLFRKILPLGDHMIVCPAHGAGSVCGESIADRVWTTIGMERMHNPKLKEDHAAFMSGMARELERPPYFRKMEELNRTGPPLLWTLPVPAPLSPAEFEQRAGGALVLDTRMNASFGASHIPGALSIWLQGLPGFAGWFIRHDIPILLVLEEEDPLPAVTHLARLGYDRIDGYLSGGMLGWQMYGGESHSIKMVPVEFVCRTLDSDETAWLLDVRGDDELGREGEIAGAHHIHITALPQHIDEVPGDRPVFIFCGSGLRSMIAGSILKREGWSDLSVVLGGTAGWKSARCPVRRP
ncbi:MAG TPA: MBL fold metallo-hydrolase [Syntrophales bacterium]|nr:MBL fold metallo-hydrolase [Syntrophales bacterium]